MNPSTKQTDVDVAVIGMGPTGLSLAKLLSQQGVGVAAIDRHRLPVGHPRATHLDDETMRSFQTLGLQELEPTFSPVGTYRFYDSQWRTLMSVAMDRGVTDQGWRSDYMFHQPDFESVLRGRLIEDPEADTYFGWEVGGLDEEGERVIVHLTEASTGNERELSAAFAVGCDGAGSLVRRATGATVTDYGATHRSLIVDIFPFVDPGETTDRGPFIQAGVRNPLTFVPIAAPRLRFEVMLRPDDDARDFERIERVHEILSPWFRADQYRLLRADVYEWNAVVSTPWKAGLMLVAGDAAHQMPPHLGQGMCSGVRDALNLGWKLPRVLRGDSPIELLDTYESERSPHATILVTVSARMANDIESMEPEAPPTGVEPPAKENETLRPPLGPGVVAEGDSAGTLSPQPHLSDGALLDDAVGFRFAIVGDPKCLEAVDEQTRKTWNDLDFFVLEGQHDEVIRWLGGLGASAAVLRPDRYVFGLAAATSELDDLTELLAAQLIGPQIVAGST